MSETIIDGPQELYLRIKDKPDLGPFAAFYTKAHMLNDPNTCSCKKGKNAKQELLRLYTMIPPQIRHEPNLSIARRLLGDGVIIFKMDGIEMSRIE